jgi:pSer/pThr/pTyr-binding forkhead associated (FHA) protein
MASALAFPAGRIAAVVAFDADEVMIGRRNEGRGIEPDVDLSGQLADPGASHRQVAIRRDPASGCFVVIDLGSTNGTTINDDDQPIEPHQPVELAAGDEIHVGAWTTIRVVV